MNIKKIVNDFDSFEKEKIRNNFSTMGRKYDVILDLPGKHCRSIEKLNQLGAIDKENSIVYAYERYPKIAKRICQKLKEINNVFVVCNDLSCADVEIPSHRFDWVNLDTCSSLNNGILTFIRSLKFNEDAELNIWLTTYRKNGKFKEGLKEFCFKNDKGWEIYKRISDLVTIEQWKCDETQKHTLCAIYAALTENYNLILEKVDSYTAHVNKMYFYRFINIKSKSASVDDWQEINMLDLTKQKKRSSTTKTNISLLNVSKQIKMICSPDTSEGVKAYGKRAIKKFLMERLQQGMEVRRVKAALKAAQTKMFGSTDEAKKCHCFIDSL